MTEFKTSLGKGAVVMEMIGFLGPAIISVMIDNRKGREAAWNLPQALFKYGLYVLINVFLTGCVITYGLGVSGVTCDALTSFPFFIKYTVIASVMAAAVPYAEEIIRKYIKITLTVRTYDESGKNPVEDHR